MRARSMTGAIAAAVAMVTVGVFGGARAVAQDAAPEAVGPQKPVNPIEVIPPFKIRPGYAVTLAAEELPGSRFMEFDDRGTLYVSNPAGEIFTLRDLDGDTFYETRGVFVRNMRSVHGLCWADGWMWFTTSGVVWKARDLNGDGAHDELIRVTKDDLPQGGNHWWRSILVGKDHFYTSIGDTGNITDESDTDRQKIFRFTLDGESKTLFASGVRNTEKLRFRPGTSEIWGVDHGSDNFGQRMGERTGRVQPITDYNPPDEFNLYVEGGFYGHPFVTGLKMPRPEFRDRKDIVELAQKTIVPEWNFGAHWAANAFCFIDPALNAQPGGFPKDHEGDAFVACRGSWNRTEKAGYQVVRVLFDPWTGKPFGMLTIVDTLERSGEDEKILARPVDCVQAPDGTVLFSCDHTSALYRLRWAGAKQE